MDDLEERSEAALKRLRAKRSFKTHLAVYVIVNTLLVVIWAVQGAGNDYWPFWTILGWGIGLAFHARSVFFQRPITDDEIRREMERG